MSTELNRFLTPLDAAFLYAERPKEPLHIGGLMVYEGEFSKERLVEEIAVRLHLLPRYRQRVLFPPFLAAHPLWVDDPDFRLANHVEEVELPADCDERELSRAAAEAYGGMLDRKRPLWHGTVLTGMPGHTAVVWKVHHAMVDGVSGVDLTMVLSGVSADEPRPEPPNGEWAPKPLPDSFTLLQAAIRHRLGEVNENLTANAVDAMRPQAIAERARELLSAARATLPFAATPAPRTPFNRRVSGDIGYAWAQFGLSAMRSIKSSLGGTVNDVVLTVLAGALGRYLRSRGERTDGLELRAMCPVSMRRKDERGQLGNLVSNMIAPLYVGIDDPTKRLAKEREAMTRLKEAGQARAFHEMTRFGVQAPPALAAAGAALPFHQTLFNTVSTNVPGPMIPLYLGEHKLVDWLPMGIVSNNIGLFVGTLSYHQRISIGVTVDNRLIPEPWALAGFLEESFKELHRAAGGTHDEPFGARCFAVPAPDEADSAKTISKAPAAEAVRGAA